MSQLRAELGLEPNISDRVRSASKMAAVNGENVVDETKAKTQVWTHDQELMLLKNVENHLQSSEVTKDIYVKDIMWSKIAFDDFDEDDPDDDLNI